MHTTDHLPGRLRDWIGKLDLDSATATKLLLFMTSKGVEMEDPQVRDRVLLILPANTP